MGGTWVSHCQPHTFREMLRYKIDRDLVTTRQHGGENDYSTFQVPGNASFCGIRLRLKEGY